VLLIILFILSSLYLVAFFSFIHKGLNTIDINLN
jgi:hypothetical protein